MSVGGQPTVAGINTLLTNLAIAWRNVAQQSANLFEEVNGQGNGVAALQAIGYAPADAQTADTLIGQMNQLSQILGGTQALGAAFNFNNSFSQLWNAQ